MDQEIVLAILRGALIVISYAFIGGGLKYIDQVYDVHVFDKRIAWILSILCGFLMGALIALDSSSSVILLGIIISVGITRKIDTLPFYTVALLSIVLPLFLNFTSIIPDYTLTIDWLLLTFLIISGISDEFLDGIGDRKRIKALTIRPMMKIMILIFCISGIFSYLYFLAFLAFDLTYMYVSRYSHEIVKVMTPLERKAKGVVLE